MHLQEQWKNTISRFNSASEFGKQIWACASLFRWCYNGNEEKIIDLETFQFYSASIFGKTKSRNCIVIERNLDARVYWYPSAKFLHDVGWTSGWKKANTLELYFETAKFWPYTKLTF